MRIPVLGLLLLAACGPLAGTELVIEAPFRAPDDCDELTVTATRDGGSGPLYSGDFHLTTRDAFPLTQVLTTEDENNLGLITLRVRALHAGVLLAPGAEVEVPVRLQRGKVIRAEVKLCACTP